MIKTTIGIGATMMNIVGSLLLCVGLTFLLWAFQDYEFSSPGIFTPVIAGVVMSALGSVVVMTARLSLSGYFNDMVADVVIGFYGVSMGPLDWTVGTISIAVAAILATKHLIFGAPTA